MAARFDGKVAWVTGAASGIGEACALRLAEEGGKVVLLDTNKEKGSEVLQKVKAKGAEAIFLELDVTDPAAVEKAVAETVETFGALDVAVNNAGIGGDLAPTGEYSPENWDKVIRVNLNGVFYCMRYQIPQMLEQGEGAILNMASILGSVGFASASAYVAAKHGVVGLTKSAAIEYGNRDIRVNAVGPAFVRTPLLDGLDEGAKVQLEDMHPIGRMGKPEEIASLVAYLCSDEASFMTGGYYPADGGYLAQ